MTATPRLPPIREGMRVRSSEGKRLGRIIHVYARESEVCVHVASVLDLWSPWAPVGAGLYFPATAIAEGQGKRVMLNMDTKTAKGCTGRPSWLPTTARSYGQFMDYGGGGSG